MRRKQNNAGKEHPEIENTKNICKSILEAKQEIQPPQKQKKQPGLQNEMIPEPISIYDDYQAANKLKNKVILITGGDSGIGRAVAYHCIEEGAKVAFVYFNETIDANRTLQEIKKRKGQAIAMQYDLCKKESCRKAIEKCLDRFGKINVLINNIAVQYPTKNVRKITSQRLRKVFTTNIFSYFYMIQEVLPHLNKGDSIINTTSITAFRGSEHLVDYSATKGAIVSLTRSLAALLIDNEIRVNAIAPGPVWTPLIPSSFSKEAVAKFGADSPLGRPAQPADIAPCYIFLASKDSAFMTGQVLHPNGGELMI
ncbi:acetyoacetyl CoA reductase [Legionella santicrucis]|uniref:Acetyoacetyl CoA reductase n=1 Tax=Legionella santicrucis TaxID=45074 RepID=A0A0W0YJD1_9GAMM|nr:SDR family oxidoreductase [Legionella santicrucis]KTD57053.1 acetyoacetyl CoA reductase [Legionella santicrucis]